MIGVTTNCIPPLKENLIYYADGVIGVAHTLSLAQHLPADQIFQNGNISGLCQRLHISQIFKFLIYFLEMVEERRRGGKHEGHCWWG